MSADDGGLGQLVAAVREYHEGAQHRAGLVSQGLHQVEGAVDELIKRAARCKFGDTVIDAEDGRHGTVRGVTFDPKDHEIYYLVEFNPEKPIERKHDGELFMRGEYTPPRLTHTLNLDTLEWTEHSA